MLVIDEVGDSEVGEVGDVSVGGGKISAQRRLRAAQRRPAKKPTDGQKGRAGRDKGDATEESGWLTRSLALCHLGAVGGLGHLAHDAAVCGLREWE